MAPLFPGQVSRKDCDPRGQDRRDEVQPWLWDRPTRCGPNEALHGSLSPGTNVFRKDYAAGPLGPQMPDAGSRAKCPEGLSVPPLPPGPPARPAPTPSHLPESCLWPDRHPPNLSAGDKLTGHPLCRPACPRAFGVWLQPRISRSFLGTSRAHDSDQSTPRPPLGT